ncbi:unnamed protein product [Gordionus sp. m RMFG-2023]|uniref:uncharacterized protein LOC135925092 isoform X2 n=1 Tax=Gordionus sp. m RMFG-2023 TaxID=3053472 RepID=UPI0030DF5265
MEIKLLDENSKECKQYQLAIDKALKNFENTEEWPDLISVLGKLQKVIQTYLYISYIPRKIILCKRLAQCLHPALPSGVHLKTLQIYELIFKTIGIKNLSEDFSIYTFGIFPLFQKASLAIKPVILNLVENYLVLPFINTDDGIVVESLIIEPGLLGLFMGIFPGIEIGSEFLPQFFKIVDKIYEHLASKGSDLKGSARVQYRDVHQKSYVSYFFHCIFVTLTKSPNSRLGVLTYLLENKVKFKPQIKELISLSNNDYTSVETSNILRNREIMIFSLCSAIMDENILVKRNVLDVMQVLVPLALLDTNMLSESKVQDKDHINSLNLRLMNIILNILVGKNTTLQKRIFNWLFPGNYDSSNKYIQRSSLFRPPIKNFLETEPKNNTIYQTNNENNGVSKKGHKRTGSKDDSYYCMMKRSGVTMLSNCTNLDRGDPNIDTIQSYNVNSPKTNSLVSNSLLSGNSLIFNSETKLDLYSLKQLGLVNDNLHLDSSTDNNSDFCNLENQLASSFQSLDMGGDPNEVDFVNEKDCKNYLYQSLLIIKACFEKALAHEAFKGHANESKDAITDLNIIPQTINISLQNNPLQCLYTLLSSFSNHYKEIKKCGMNDNRNINSLLIRALTFDLAPSIIKYSLDLLPRDTLGNKKEMDWLKRLITHNCYGKLILESNMSDLMNTFHLALWEKVQTKQFKHKLVIWWDFINLFCPLAYANTETGKFISDNNTIPSYTMIWYNLINSSLLIFFSVIQNHIVDIDTFTGNIEDNSIPTLKLIMNFINNCMIDKIKLLNFCSAIDKKCNLNVNNLIDHDIVDNDEMVLSSCNPIDILRNIDYYSLNSSLNQEYILNGKGIACKSSSYHMVTLKHLYSINDLTFENMDEVDNMIFRDADIIETTPINICSNKSDSEEIFYRNNDTLLQSSFKFDDACLCQKDFAALLAIMENIYDNMIPKLSASIPYQTFPFLAGEFNSHAHILIKSIFPKTLYLLFEKLFLNETHKFNPEKGLSILPKLDYIYNDNIIKSSDNDNETSHKYYHSTFNSTTKNVDDIIYEIMINKSQIIGKIIYSHFYHFIYFINSQPEKLKSDPESNYNMHLLNATMKSFSDTFNLMKSQLFSNNIFCHHNRLHISALLMSELILIKSSPNNINHDIMKLDDNFFSALINDIWENICTEYNYDCQNRFYDSHHDEPSNDSFFILLSTQFSPNKMTHNANLEFYREYLDALISSEINRKDLTLKIKSLNKFIQLWTYIGNYFIKHPPVIDANDFYDCNFLSQSILSILELFKYQCEESLLCNIAIRKLVETIFAGRNNGQHYWVIAYFLRPILLPLILVYPSLVNLNDIEIRAIEYQDKDDLSNSSGVCYKFIRIEKNSAKNAGGIKDELGSGENDLSSKDVPLVLASHCIMITSQSNSVITNSYNDSTNESFFRSTDMTPILTIYNNALQIVIYPYELEEINFTLKCIHDILLSTPRQSSQDIATFLVSSFPILHSSQTTTSFQGNTFFDKKFRNNIEILLFTCIRLSTSYFTNFPSNSPESEKTSNLINSQRLALHEENCVWALKIVDKIVEACLNIRNYEIFSDILHSIINYKVIEHVLSCLNIIPFLQTLKSSHFTESFLEKERFLNIEENLLLINDILHHNDPKYRYLELKVPLLFDILNKLLLISKPSISSKEKFSQGLHSLNPSLDVASEAITSTFKRPNFFISNPSTKLENSFVLYYILNREIDNCASSLFYTCFRNFYLQNRNYEHLSTTMESKKERWLNFLSNSTYYLLEMNRAFISSTHIEQLSKLSILTADLKSLTVSFLTHLFAVTDCILQSVTDFESNDLERCNSKCLPLNLVNLNACFALILKFCVSSRLYPDFGDDLKKYNLETTILTCPSYKNWFDACLQALISSENLSKDLYNLPDPTAKIRDPYYVAMAKELWAFHNPFYVECFFNYYLYINSQPDHGKYETLFYFISEIIFKHFFKTSESSFSLISTLCPFFASSCSKDPHLPIDAYYSKMPEIINALWNNLKSNQEDFYFLDQFLMSTFLRCSLIWYGLKDSSIEPPCSSFIPNHVRRLFKHLYHNSNRFIGIYFTSAAKNCDKKSQGILFNIFNTIFKSIVAYRTQALLTTFLKQRPFTRLTHNTKNDKISMLEFHHFTILELHKNDRLNCSPNFENILNNLDTNILFQLLSDSTFLDLIVPGMNPENLKNQAPSLMILRNLHTALSRFDKLFTSSTHYQQNLLHNTTCEQSLRDIFQKSLESTLHLCQFSLSNASWMLFKKSPQVLRQTQPVGSYLSAASSISTIPSLPLTLGSQVDSESPSASLSLTLTTPYRSSKPIRFAFNQYSLSPKKRKKSRQRDVANDYQVSSYHPDFPSSRLDRSDLSPPAFYRRRRNPVISSSTATDNSHAITPVFVDSPHFSLGDLPDSNPVSCRHSLNTSTTNDTSLIGPYPPGINIVIAEEKPQDSYAFQRRYYQTFEEKGQTFPQHYIKYRDFTQHSYPVVGSFNKSPFASNTESDNSSFDVLFQNFLDVFSSLSPKSSRDSRLLFQTEHEHLLFKIILSPNVNSIIHVAALNTIAYYVFDIMDILYSDEFSKTTVGGNRPYVYTLISPVIFPYLKERRYFNAPAFEASAKILEKMFKNPESEMNVNQSLLKIFRKDSWDLFCDQNFFKSSDITSLISLGFVINRLILADNAYFKEIIGHLSPLNTNYSSSFMQLFSRTEQENGIRLAWVKRLAFMIHCGAFNQYEKHLPEIQEKLVEYANTHYNVSSHLFGPTQQFVRHATLCSVFLCFEVLTLKVSDSRLLSLWPVIMTLSFTILREFWQHLLDSSQVNALNQEIDQTPRSVTPPCRPLTLPLAGNGHLVTHCAVDNQRQRLNSSGSERFLISPSALQLMLSLCRLLEFALALPPDKSPYFQSCSWCFVNSSFIGAVKLSDLQKIARYCCETFQDNTNHGDSLHQDDHHTLEPPMTLSGITRLNALNQLTPFFRKVLAVSDRSFTTFSCRGGIKTLQNYVAEEFAESYLADDMG